MLTTVPRTAAGADCEAAVTRWAECDLGARRGGRGWRTLTLRVPSARDRQVAITVDRGTGGQPQQARAAHLRSRDGRHRLVGAIRVAQRGPPPARRPPVRAYRRSAWPRRPDDRRRRLVRGGDAWATRASRSRFGGLPPGGAAGTPHGTARDQRRVGDHGHAEAEAARHNVGAAIVAPPEEHDGGELLMRTPTASTASSCRRATWCCIRRRACTTSVRLHADRFCSNGPKSRRAVTL